MTVEGEPWPYCPRTILRNAVARAAKLGFSLKMGLEAEFFLVRKDDDGELVVDDPLDTSEQPCYDAKALYRNYEFLTTLSRYANELGYGNYANDHEDANGQFESNFTYDDALVTCDRAIFFRYMVHVMAQQRGKLATFMPKPFGHLTGNGCHFHISLWDKAGKKNLFEGASDAHGYGLSDDAYHFIAGLIHHAEAVSAIVAPTVNSYKRIGVGAPDSGATWSPAYAAWGGNNRTQMIRVPGGPRIEHRGIDGSANPYLAADGRARRRPRRHRAQARPGPAEHGQPLHRDGAGGQAQAHQEPADDARRRHRGAAQGRRPARLVRPHGQRALQRLLRRHQAGASSRAGTPRSRSGRSTATSRCSRRGAPRSLGRRAVRAPGGRGQRHRRALAGPRPRQPARSTSASTGSASSPASGRRPRTTTARRRRSSTCSRASGLSWRAGETHEVRRGRLPRLPARARRAHADRRRRARWTCSRSASAGRPSSATCRARACSGRARPGPTTPRPRAIRSQREAKAGQLPLPRGLAAAGLDRAPRRRRGAATSSGRAGSYRSRRLGVAARGAHERPAAHDDRSGRCTATRGTATAPRRSCSCSSPERASRTSATSRRRCAPATCSPGRRARRSRTPSRRPGGLEYLAYGQRHDERHRLLPRLGQARRSRASA